MVYKGKAKVLEDLAKELAEDEATAEGRRHVLTNQARRAVEDAASALRSYEAEVEDGIA